MSAALPPADQRETPTPCGAIDYDRVCNRPAGHFGIHEERYRDARGLLAVWPNPNSPDATKGAETPTSVSLPRWMFSHTGERFLVVLDPDGSASIDGGHSDPEGVAEAHELRKRLAAIRHPVGARFLMVTVEDVPPFTGRLNEDAVATLNRSPRTLNAALRARSPAVPAGADTPTCGYCAHAAHAGPCTNRYCSCVQPAGADTLREAAELVVREGEATVAGGTAVVSARSLSALRAALRTPT